MQTIEHLNTLVRAYVFERYWIYYLLTSGSLYKDDCIAAAGILIEHIRNLEKTDVDVLNPQTETIKGRVDIRKLFDSIENWVKTKSKYPTKDINESSLLVRLFLNDLTAYLIKQMGSSVPWTTHHLGEYEHYEENVRWIPHLPMKILGMPPMDVMSIASQTDTIVVLADIRKSQELMTYALTPASFSRNIVDFLETTRLYIDRYCGIFDKFTGDGFLAYFNKGICEKAGVNYISCFINFLLEEKRYANELFAEWCKEVKKLPSEKIGLSMGADVGKLDFKDLDGHLVVVGDAIVWANRMASEGGADEVVLNNLAYELVKNWPGVQFTEREGKTKSDERFLARILSFQNP